jgi:acetyl esterase/lipase
VGATGRRPAAYMIHGGSWMAGSRSDWDAEAKEWASRGWVVINADHTRGVMDGVQGDGRQIKADIITVVRKYELLSYVNRYRQVMVGDSSGGHLATLVSAYLHGHLRAAIGWSPVAIPANAAKDGADPDAVYEVQALGPKAEEFWSYSSGTTSALRYEAAYGGPPMMLIGSTDEWLSWDHQGGALCAAIGSRCTKILVSGTLHGNRIRDTYPAIAEKARNYALHAIAI